MPDICTNRSNGPRNKKLIKILKLVTTIKYLNAATFWGQSRNQPALDLRSPGEYASGHLPGAINLPLFDDEQRAEIGTIYKNLGSTKAILHGLKVVGPKQAELVERAMQLVTEDRVLLHCWRGGMRSRSFANVVQMTGVQPLLLEGGYKAFRQWARSFFQQPWRMVVISGLTGVGKTQVLNDLQAAGEQVLDLEGLANHRGSAFGGISQPPQPTTEQFQNLLFQKLVDFDPQQIVWIEDEASRVGKVVIPDPLFIQFRHAPALFLECSRQRRIQNLVQDYGDADQADLLEGITKIGKRIDGVKLKTAQHAILSNDLVTAADIILEYYDKRYLVALPKIPRETMIKLNLETIKSQSRTDHIIEVGRTLHPMIASPC